MQTFSGESASLVTVAADAAVVMTDEEVIARVRNGETKIFEVLMRRYNQRLYRAARAILGSDTEAEDAVQQAYLNAYRHLPQFEGRAKFSTWLTRIAVYEALARRRRSRRTPAPSDGNAQAERVPTATPNPEHQAYASQLGTLLEAAVTALPDAYRTVFLLREVDGLNTAETARQLRLSEGTIKTRLHRAKDLLQRKLQDVTPAGSFRFDGARCDRLITAVLRNFKP